MCPAPINSYDHWSEDDWLYDDRLEYLGLWSLEERRNRSDLLEVFRVFKGLSVTPFNHFFTQNTSANMRVTVLRL